jgi:hypothetical protein
MALAAPQQDLITNTGIACKTLRDLQGIIEEVDTLFNDPAFNWAALITDQEISGVPSFAEIGLTAQNVADAIFQIKTVNAQVQTGNLPALIILSLAAQ